MARRNIIIIGKGEAGLLLQKDIAKNNPELHVLGFIDDSTQTSGGKILGKISDMEKVLADYRVDEMVLAVPSADGGLVRKVLLANLGNRIPIKIVPRSQKVIGTRRVSYDLVKDLETEDFLGRPFVRQNIDRLQAYYKGKTVFVTGGAGSIGSEIVRQLVDLGVKKVVVYDNSEYLVFMLEQQLKESGQLERAQLIIGSVLNHEKVSRLLAVHQPDIIFHAAAYKHVHLMQDNIDESIHNNVIGTKRLIDEALKHNIKLFTFISTDKVVNPTSVMGATKKLGEYYINHLGNQKTKFNIVRFGNVINSNGSALPLFERQIRLHKYVTVTHRDMERFFMSIREAAQLVIESTALGEPNSVHVLNMGELINIYQLALCLVRSKNLLPHQDIEIRETGLRKGEKMIEELYTKHEERQLKKTADDRIFVLKRGNRSKTDIMTLLDELEACLHQEEPAKKLKAILVTIFPELKL